MLRSGVIGAYAGRHMPAAMQEASSRRNNMAHLAKIHFLCYVLSLFP